MFTQTSCKKEEKAEHKVRIEVDDSQNYDMWSFSYSYLDGEIKKTETVLPAPITQTEFTFVGRGEFGWGFHNLDKSPINDTVSFKVYHNGALFQDIKIYTDQPQLYGSFVIE